MSASTGVATAAAGLAGLVFGSFANVVIQRVPRGESVVRPPSACPACGRRIAARDNLPVLGWLLLRGRCRHCRAPIGATYPLVELATAALWALVTAQLWPAHPWAVPAYLVLAFACLVLAVIDLRTRRLPDAVTKPAFVAVLALLAAAAAAEREPGRLVRALAAAVGVGGLFWLVARLRPGWLGRGDVKLVPTLALALGWLSWSALVVGFYAAFLLGGVAGLYAMLVLGRSRKSALPFGPSLAIGTVVGILTAGPVAAWYGRFLVGG
jgi:leader peptidase (prepilin peptidase)/N-methyltransferase